MRLRWSTAAADDLEQISSYLQVRHPSFARDTIQQLYNAAKSLKQFPEKGRVGAVVGTRELILSPLPYLIVYAIQGEAIHLLRIFDGAQNRF